MKLYDKVRWLLEVSQDCRNSDKEVIWRIWEDEYSVKTTGGGQRFLTKELYMRATNSETIRRTRQKVQEDHPELQSDKKVLESKKKKESTKGIFVYHEPFTGKLFN